MKRNSDFSVYAILDIDYIILLKKNWVKCLKETLKGGATAVQLRSKTMSDAAFYSAALKTKNICAPYKAVFIVNDRVDAAAAAGADGIHIGMDDMPFAAAKKIIKKTMLIGISASTVKEALACDKLKADYMGIGPVFATEQKNTAPMGAAAIKKLMPLISTPVVAIGGINSYNINDLKKIGIKNFSFISAIFSAGDVCGRTRAIKSIIDSKEI